MTDMPSPHHKKINSFLHCFTAFTQNLGFSQQKRESSFLCSRTTKTAQVTPFQFTEIYLREAWAGVTDLVLVLINYKGSSIYIISLQTIVLFYEEHPEHQDVLNILKGIPIVIHGRDAFLHSKGYLHSVSFVCFIIHALQIFCEFLHHLGCQ
ncbi:MAG: hypothetical protein PUE91_06260 [Clostridiales bacterium]|nr:hypothetical protein [Clostridiales bacterium]